MAAMGSYLRPVELDEALAALAARPRVVLAGGTDYYPSRVGRSVDDDILDITGLSALRAIAQRGGFWRIPALATWSDVIAANLPPLFHGLKLAAREVGGVQIQNAGTVCGNLATAAPAAAGIPNLLALDARGERASAAGRRELPVADFVTGNRRTVRRPDELVTALLVPAPRRATRSTFLKLGARKYLVISIVMVGAAVETDGDTITAARVAVGSCSAAAKRLPALEQRLVGCKLAPSLASIAEASDLSPLSPIDDVRGTAAYRSDAALTLVGRALAELAQ